MIFVNCTDWFYFWYFNCTAAIVHWNMLKCVFECNYLFNCRLHFKNMVLREIFGGKLEILTGGWRKLQWVLGEWVLCCIWDVSEKWKILTKFFVWKSEWIMYVVVDWRNYIRTFFRHFGSGISPGLIWFSTETFRRYHSNGQSDAVSPWYCNSYTEGTTVPARAMLSVRDTAIATQKVPLYQPERCCQSVILQ